MHRDHSRPASARTRHTGHPRPPPRTRAREPLGLDCEGSTRLPPLDRCPWTPDERRRVIGRRRSARQIVLRIRDEFATRRISPTLPGGTGRRSPDLARPKTRRATPRPCQRLVSVAAASEPAKPVHDARTDRHQRDDDQPRHHGGEHDCPAKRQHDRAPRAMRRDRERWPVRSRLGQLQPEGLRVPEPAAANVGGGRRHRLSRARLSRSRWREPRPHRSGCEQTSHTAAGPTTGRSPQ